MSLIFQKLINIQKQIKPIPKAALNKADQFKFRSIYDIYKELNPLFTKEQVFVYPEVHETTETFVNTTKGRQLRVKLRVSWTFTCSDGSSLKTTTSGEGISNSDKATNIALTNSLKYLLIHMFLIPTDPFSIDGDYHSPTIEPFEEDKPKVSKPSSLLAMAESKGLNRIDLKVIGEKLKIDINKELSNDDRKRLYDFLDKRTEKELKGML